MTGRRRRTDERALPLRVERATAFGLASASLAALLVATPGCFLSGFERGDEPTGGAANGGSGGGGSDVGGMGGAGAAPVCQHITFPDPPTTGTPGGDEDFVVALRSVDLGDSGASIGYDLDVRCTCDTEGESCASPGPDPICDEPGGIDNAGKGLIQLIGLALSQFSSTDFSNGAEVGQWSLVFRVRDYNGEPNDEQVRLDLYLVGSFGAGGMNIGPPLWDGTDMWPISDENFVGMPPYDLDAPVYFDPNAYVTNGVLVGALPSTELRFAGSSSSATVRVTAGLITGTLTPQGNGYRLTQGTIAGRWLVSDVFQTFASYRDNNGVGICTDDIAYALAKPEICSAPDISSVPVTPTTPCDSLSIGIRFEAHPVLLGPVFTPAMTGPVCPMGTDPAFDSCP